MTNQQFLVTTPKNPQYTGKTYGVWFHNGKAVLDASTVDDDVGLTVEQLAKRLADEFGYIVEPLGVKDAKESRK